MAFTFETAVEGRSRTFLLGVAITDSTLKRFVKMSAENTVILCTSGARAMGVVKEIGAIGDAVPVGFEGEFLVEVGSGGVTRGVDVMSDGTGQAVILTALSAVSPAGAVAVLSDATPVTMDMAGGALPSKIAGVSLDTAAEGAFARVRLI